MDVTTVRLPQNPDVWVTDLLWDALSLLRPRPDDPWIIGGDFNLSETFDDRASGPRGNHEYLGRMNRLGLTDCLREAKKALTPIWAMATIRPISATDL